MVKVERQPSLTLAEQLGPARSGGPGVYTKQYLDPKGTHNGQKPLSLDDVCIYLYIYIFFLHIYIYIHVYTYISIYIYIIYVYIYVYTVYTYIYIYISLSLSLRKRRLFAYSWGPGRYGSQEGSGREPLTALAVLTISRCMSGEGRSKAGASIISMKNKGEGQKNGGPYFNSAGRLATVTTCIRNTLSILLSASAMVTSGCPGTHLVATAVTGRQS